MGCDTHFKVGGRWSIFGFLGVSISVLNLMQEPTGSQWRQCFTEVVWENLKRLKTSCAFAFWISCSGQMTQRGRPARRTLH